MKRHHPKRSWRAGCGESRTSGSEGGGEENHRPKSRHRRLAADPAHEALSARRLLLHAAWLEDGALLRDVDKLTGIPCVLIHGRVDLSAPLDIPWMLAGSWDGSELVVIEDTGHTRGPTMTAALIAATDGFATPHR